MDHVKDGKLEDLTEDQWKKECFKRWKWMRSFYNADYEENTTPAIIAQEQENRDNSQFIYQTKE